MIRLKPGPDRIRGGYWLSEKDHGAENKNARNGVTIQKKCHPDPELKRQSDMR